MEKSNFRVRVMKYAHQLAKTTEYTWKNLSYQGMGVIQTCKKNEKRHC